MLKRIIIIVAVMVVLAALGFGWYRLQHHQMAKPTPKPVAMVVTAAPVKTQTIIKTVQAVGVLYAKQQINVASQLAGKVKSIDYTPGAFVKKGALLIQLDDSLYQANLRSSLAALRLAKINYQRQQNLSVRKLTPQQDVDQARATYEEAQAKVNADKTFVEHCKISAPFSGYVGAKNVSIGDYVQEGQTLTTLTDRSLLQVNYALPEKYVLNVKLGQKVSLNVPHEKDHFYLGTVSYVSPIVNPDTHSIDIEADVPNPNNVLAPGLFVEIKQNLGQVNDAVVIPQQAVVPTITGAEVYLVKGDKAYTQKVKLGTMLAGGNIEVEKGLKKGDRIVITGQQNLKNGSLIREVKAP